MKYLITNERTGAECTIDVDPDPFVTRRGSFMVGARETDTTTHIFIDDGSGTATALDLGSDFPVGAKIAVRRLGDAGPKGWSFSGRSGKGGVSFTPSGAK